MAPRKVDLGQPLARPVAEPVPERVSSSRRDGARPAPETVISARGLRMAYGDLEAVRGIDLEVRRGEVFAFLGPNGAGKTTTVEVLEGYLTRTGGDVAVLGVDPQHGGPAWRERAGVVLQESAVEPDLTVRECLKLFAGYYGSPRVVDDLIELVGLSGKADVLGGHLSGGQRRRLDVALALVGDPELVFLDEPTTGFDPSARRAAWEMIAGLQALGKTVFLTTHYMEEAEYLADRICVLAAGKIVGEGTPLTLGGRDSAPTEISFTLPAGVEQTDLPADLVGSATVQNHGRVELKSHEPMEVLGALAGWSRENGHRLSDIEVHRPTLEDIYLRLTEESK
jgi:ABC-2 type transport system ATP-binding protein